MIKKIKEMNAKNKKITEKDLKQIIYKLKNLWENKVYFTIIYSIEKRVFGNLKGLYKLKKKNKNVNIFKLKKKFSYLFSNRSHIKGFSIIIPSEVVINFSIPQSIATILPVFGNNFLFNFTIIKAYHLLSLSFFINIMVLKLNRIVFY